ncbi:DUF1287 domain-containing protein [Pseudocitrobacter vendiensis]|uniref:DUF1287 domain-containing protein n=1 Tax=Pseudocitrobacter vendiensis TaxID=2488306 RepID=A0ABM9FCQ2_9ENTR|nr:DUF1287 domain-containing protein [Pseudocitrobacter vendiensis]CAH6660974.1 DUF1287 domain-containing protein [Pseudocitrobacter vendiensis]
MKLLLALITLFAATFIHHSPPLDTKPITVQPQTNAAIAQGAVQQIGKTLYYDAAYVRLAYPNGDIPLERGVCADVVIRALRTQQVDLQKLLHEDMLADFAAYPQNWKLKRPDSNIDHRRVPNLETWFQRHDKALSITDKYSDYQPGDVVSWRLNNGLAHIGVVSLNRAYDGTPLMVHNIGAGAQEEDVLFSWRIVGHYRYYKR